MEKTKTLIAFASKGGATREAAELIAKVLKEQYSLEVDLFDLKDNTPDLSEYGNVVIGAGVRVGRIYKKALKFMDKDFTDKKVALFLSSGEGGDEKGHEEAIEKYIKNQVLERVNVEPVAAEVFGGRIKIFGFTVQNNIDTTKIEQWAKAVGEKFSTSEES